jgi:hypothetical protein
MFNRRVFAIAIAAVFMSITTVYAADELCTVAKDHCKILAEDAKVRVID